MSKNWVTNMKYQEKLEEVEIEIREHYQKRRLKIENEAISKIREDPSHFYKYAKKFSKGENNIAALRNGEMLVTNDCEKANILQKQYVAMWSKPVQKLSSCEMHEYFSECNECIYEKTHFCKYDNVPDHILDFKEYIRMLI